MVINALEFQYPQQPKKILSIKFSFDIHTQFQLTRWTCSIDRSIDINLHEECHWTVKLVRISRLEFRQFFSV